MTDTSRVAIVQSSPVTRVAALIGLLALVALVAAPYWAGRADMRLLSEVYLYLALACLWNILAGYAGLVSVGQQAYVGLGGYLLFALAIFGGVSPLVAIPLAGAIGALSAAAVAVLIFRLRGAYFAIGTWVVAECFRLGFAQVTALGGGSGTSLPAGIVTSMADGRDAREALLYWLSLGIATIVVAAIFLLLRSRRGLALQAIRDNELAAKSLGIDIWRSKFFIYVAASALTASVGALIFLQKLRISPDAAFSLNDWTAFVIFIVVIGGIGTLEGPIIGTIVFFVLRETMADLGTTYLLILGLVAIVVMLRAPQGLWGYVRKRFGIELFPTTLRAIDTQTRKEL